MDPEALFRTNLAVVERVVREVCRSARMHNAHEVDDFTSSVMVALMENDYAILRKWEGRASLAGYLNVVIRRLLFDRRDHELGRWHPSTEAARGGPAAVLLEKLLIRDSVPFDDAVRLVRQKHLSCSPEELAAMAERFPRRPPRLRAVDLEAVEEVAMPERDRADERVLVDEARRLSLRASEIMRGAIESWPDEDAMILRFRFGSSMTIADISRMLRIPQRPLYRRIDGLLGRLRAALEAAGLDASMLADVVGQASQEMDFGLEPPAAAKEDRR